MYSNRFTNMPNFQQNCKAIPYYYSYGYRSPPGLSPVFARPFSRLSVTSPPPLPPPSRGPMSPVPYINVPLLAVTSAAPSTPTGMSSKPIDFNHPARVSMTITAGNVRTVSANLCSTPLPGKPMPSALHHLKSFVDSEHSSWSSINTEPWFEVPSPKSSRTESPVGSSAGSCGVGVSSLSQSSDNDDCFNSIWDNVCEMTPAPVLIKYRQIRGRGFNSKTNVTNLKVAVPKPLCYRPLIKIKSCVFCIKLDPDAAKTHNMKDQNRVVCPLLRNYICPICGTPDKDAAHTVRFCPKNQF